MQRMKIAHVTATFPPYKGGTGNVCYHNAIQLARLNHEVDVFTSLQPNTNHEEKIEGVRIHRLKPWMQIGNAPLLPQLILTLKRFDIVHLHYPFIFGAELVRLATLFSQTPFVVTLHNDLIGDGLRAKLFAIYQLISARFSIRPANRLCAVSTDHYRYSRLFMDMGKKRPTAIELPNGVDAELFKPGQAENLRKKYEIPPSANIVLFVAALDRAHHFKGLERLLHAISDLPELWLLVVGDGDLKAKYEKLAVDLNIFDRVQFVGAKSQAELPPFYQVADLTVLPSSPPESFGMVLIESMACSTPVIASDIPGVRSVVKDGIDGFLVEEGNILVLTEKLKTFFGLPVDEQVQMGKSGRAKVVEYFSWRQIGEKLAHCYSQVLTDQGHT